MPPLSASGARVLREVEAHRKQQRQQGDAQPSQLQAQRRVARPRQSGGQQPGGGSGTVVNTFLAPDNVTAFLTPLSLAVAVRGPSTTGLPATSPVTTRRRAADTAMQLATSALAALGEHSGGESHVQLQQQQRWGGDGAAADAHATAAASSGGELRRSHADDNNASSPRRHATPDATPGSFSPRRLLAGMLGSPRGRGASGMASSMSVEQQHALLTEVATLRAALAHAQAQLADVHAAHASALAALSVLGAPPGDAAVAQQAPAGSVAPGSLASLAAPATSRLRSLLLWTDPERSARVLGGCAYILLCIRWGTHALSLTGVAAAMHAALVFLALSFVRQRLGRLMGWAPRQQAAQSIGTSLLMQGLSHHDSALVAQEQAIRAAAVSAAAKAAALMSRGAPLVAELWVATSQLLSGVCPVLTFRVALWLWLTAKTCALVALSPWHFACVALGAAFTVPLLMHTAGAEFQTISAALQLHLRARYDATPTGVRWLAACLAAWMAWHMSGLGTRAFAAFLALVKATEWAHAWAERMVARAEQDGAAVKPSSSCVLTELPDDSAKME